MSTPTDCWIKEEFEPNRGFTQSDVYDIVLSTEIDEMAGELSRDVRTADLTKYQEHQLEGRRGYYEREALFERDPVTRAALKGELERTNIELDRRRAMRMAEADRVFA